MGSCPDHKTLPPSVILILGFADPPSPLPPPRDAAPDTAMLAWVPVRAMVPAGVPPRVRMLRDCAVVKDAAWVVGAPDMPVLVAGVGMQTRAHAAI